jgi:hypothetical protein
MFACHADYATKKSRNPKRRADSLHPGDRRRAQSAAQIHARTPAHTVGTPVAESIAVLPDHDG